MLDWLLQLSVLSSSKIPNKSTPTHPECSCSNCCTQWSNYTKITKGPGWRGKTTPATSIPSPTPLPFLFPSPSFILPYHPLNQLGGLGERCKLPQRGPGQSPGRKRIWCTLKLPESHWWQLFCIFWVPCFTRLKRYTGDGVAIIQNRCTAL